MSRIEIVMPKIGLTMEEGEIQEWLVEVGQSVQVGDIVALIETEKVTFELESPASGVVAECSEAVGAVVRIGTPIGYIEGREN